MSDPFTEETLSELVSLPESESLEFKRTLRDRGMAARELSALANSGGGRIVIGVDDRTGLVGDPDPSRSKKLLQSAADELSPSLNVEVREATLDGHPLVIAEVPAPPEDQAPIIAPDGALVRRGRGGESVPLSGSEIVQAFQHAQPGLDPEQAAEKALGEINGRLAALEEATRAGFDAAARARGWWPQLQGWVIGGIVGALIGAGLTLLIGS
jgi:predicted HTH transcriptional regulator